MPPGVALRSTDVAIELVNGAQTAQALSPVRFGHLGSVRGDRQQASRKARKAGGKPLEDFPRDLIELAKASKSASAAESVGLALRRACETTGARGVVLVDTMRGGSDYWRPGKLLSEAAAASDVPRVEFGRFDALCPSAALLDEYRRTTMPFPTYAARYADELSRTGSIDVTVAEVVRAQARELIAVFYCTDPYVPGYADASELASDVPFDARRWHRAAQLRDEGCHRVVLADRVARRLRELGAQVELFELDPTTCGVHERRFR